MTLMRFNKYISDPYSAQNPSLTIASRADLIGSCHGAYDAKIEHLVNLAIMVQLKFI